MLPYADNFKRDADLISQQDLHLPTVPKISVPFQFWDTELWILISCKPLSSKLKEIYTSVCNDTYIISFTFCV